MAMAPPHTKRLSPAPSIPTATASQTPRSRDQKSGGIGQEPAIAGGRAHAGFGERSHQGAQPTGGDAAVGIGKGQDLGAFACGAHGGYQVLNLLGGGGVLAMRQYDADARGQDAWRDIVGGVRGDDEFVVGIIQSGEGGQVFTQAFVVALDRHDDGGGRQAAGCSARRRAT